MEPAEGDFASLKEKAHITRSQQYQLALHVAALADH